MNWFAQMNGQQVGPYTTEQMRAAPRGTMVWRQGMTNWQPVEQCPEIHAPATPAAPPPGPPVGAYPPAGAPPAGYAQPGAPPQPNLAGMFYGMEGARASQDSNYTRPGTYVMQIVRIKAGVASQNGEFVAVEMRCIAVIDEGRLDPAQQPPHRVGEDNTYMMMKKFQSFLGNVKAAIGAIIGCPEAQVTAQVTAECMSDKQPCANTFIEVYGHSIRTRPKPGQTIGGLFTKVVFRQHVPAAHVKQYLTQHDPSGQAEQRFFPGGLLDQIIAYQKTRGIGVSPLPAAPTAPAFGAAPPPMTPPAAAPGFPPPAAPAAPPAFPGAPGAFPGAPAASPPFTPGPAPGAAPPPFGAPAGPPAWPPR